MEEEPAGTEPAVTEPAVTVDVAVVGLGYVGLVLTVALARAGLRVAGTERHEAAREAVRRGTPLFWEPGLTETLAALPAGRLEVRRTLDGVQAQAVVICVGTGYDPMTSAPDLTDLRAAVAMALPVVGGDTLMVVRSTVPVGACRSVVLPMLQRVQPAPLLAYCPERTIQGRALTEIASLPQIIGGLDETSTKRAGELFSVVTPTTVPVSSLEVAELVKLVCNAHTDMLYGFGNEVAFMADAFGVSGREVIEAANRGYPRPDIALPGYVGGSCLVKDPYLLQASSRTAGYAPRLVPAARAVNELLPEVVAQRVLDGLERRAGGAAAAKVLVCGIAYKGRPETDDVRGAASVPLARALAGRVARLAGHDPLVPPMAIAGAGFEPTTVEDGLRDAQAVVVLTDHPAYRTLDPAAIIAAMRPAPLVVDVWGVLNDRFAATDQVEYIGFGYG